MNTDDLRLLWDCVTRFHGRWFPSEPQPRATQIRLLWEEWGEVSAAYYENVGNVYEELADLLFVTFGIVQTCSTVQLHEILAVEPKVIGCPRALDNIVGRMGFYERLRGDMDTGLAALIHGVKHEFILGNHEAEFHAAVTAVITKNDAKTAANGYRVNAGGKVTKP